ncbi:DUF421 domain-containing protein [Mycolicibacterium chlorophenolicum]|uniref:DUF421 domain-containing protein n=1 Tax=Mycolicibacterium chlorophenolicum TaxID=37916 RepID=UPI001443DC79|nr:YetF domain-containing protein [Mycolicibacterium chlorophenolicum]
MVATVVMYAAFVLLVRIMGQRSLASMAAFDLALVVAVGSLIARTSLLQEPTLAQGLVALVTLFVLQYAVSRLRRFRRVNHLVSRRPVLLVVDGAILPDQLRTANLLAEELRQKLRLAGVGSLADVSRATLERNGSISVIRSGARLDNDVMIDVDGALDG